jgi:hypothetical protein
VYADVRQLCQQSCLRITGSYLTPGWDVIKRSPLADHPVYGHYMQLLEYLGQDRWYMGQRFAINPDLLFALPGDPDLRRMLATTFRPPVTLFYNGRWTRESLGHFAGFGEHIDLNDEVAKLADMADQQSQGIDLKKVLDPDLLADEAADIHRRVGEMRHAMTIARYRQR